MLSARVLRMLVATASIGVGLCCFSLMGCSSESSDTAASGGSSTETVETAAPAKEPAPVETAQADPSAVPKNDFATVTPKAPGNKTKPAAAAEGIWTSDYKAALAQAKKEKKDILMNFTGSDWCGYCIELEDKVFRFKEFADYAKKNFVLLELDFPNDRTNLTPETQMQNAKLQEQFSIEGFPTILLADAEGRPYARTGYAPGGPEEYVAHLTELTDVRVKRDAAFAAAADLSGVEKAKKLDEALKTMSPEWTFTSYEDVVQEIVSLDAGDEAGLRKEYDEQLLTAKLRTKLKEIQQLIQMTGNIDGALEKIDEIEAEFTDFEPARAIAVQFRLQLLQMDGRNDEVVKMADTLLADETTKADARLPLFGAKLNALAQAEKYEAALEVADSMRQEFTEDKQLSTRILIARADLLGKLKRDDEARAALQEARDMGGEELESMVDQAEKDIFSADDEDDPASDSDESPADAAESEADDAQPKTEEAEPAAEETEPAADEAQPAAEETEEKTEEPATDEN